MQLTDGTLTLRTPDETDADLVADAVRASYAELAPFMPWASAHYSSTDALQWIRGEIDPTGHPFVMIDQAGGVVGSCGLNRFDEEHSFANLGYWVSSAATGNGYATRATRLLARHALADLALARVEVLMSVENDASRRVAERAGALHEGVLRNRLRLGDRHHDAHLFSFVTADLDGCLAADS